MLQKQKGQSMVEFALILPLLLLLILGIVEATRTIWAFITVQQAAREAARFAVTGRPYLDAGSGVAFSAPASVDICRGVGTEPDPFDSNVAPWSCPDATNDPSHPPLVEPPAEPDYVFWNPRVEAIKKKAIETGHTLAVSQVCSTPDEFKGENGDTCNQVPGAFGVMIRGQVTMRTVTGTLEVRKDPVDDHAGYQGLNVRVDTFYNLQMITPIFDAIMGGTFIRLRGSAQLQNEGIDKASGIEPPAAIGAVDIEGGTGGGGSSPTLGSILPQNPELTQSEKLKVQLLNYDAASPHHDIFLQLGGILYKICTDVVVTGDPTYDCGPLTNVPLGPDFSTSGPVPRADNYTLFSVETTYTGGPSKVTSNQTVDVVPGDQPLIYVDGKAPYEETTVWATSAVEPTGEIMPIELKFHDPGTGYAVKLFDPAGNEYPIGSYAGGSTIDWPVPPVASPCGVDQAATCQLKSFITTDLTTPIATTDVKINNPLIQLSNPSNGVAYVRGEHVDITLFRHTPSRSYKMEIPTGTASGLTSLPTDEKGDTYPLKVTWIIPGSCGASTGFPDGSYVLSSHSTIDNNVLMAQASFDVQTPPEPQVTIAGGTTWPAGSAIKVVVLQHAVEATHYLEISNEDGSNAVRIPTGAVDNTFQTDFCGNAQVVYKIPPETMEGNYVISSFDQAGNFLASVDITVLTIPLIHVLEGDTVMPEQTITISGTNHIPSTSYNIYYANKFLQNVIADTNGAFQFPYSLANLPTSPPPDLSNFSNLGVPYVLDSQTAAGEVASTTLTIQGADLMVTQVEVAAVAPLSSTVPVKIVVQNLMPVTISQFVDVDLYNLQIPIPDPFGPSYLAGYNFPGDVKFWKNGVGPNETFSFSYNLPLDELGQKSLYGYADVSNNIYEGETAGQVANPNNIDESPLLVNCPVTVSSDAFNDAALPGWTETVYGNGGTGTLATAGGGLSLNSSGSTTLVSNDNSGGQLLLHQSTAFSTAFGLDVQVKLSHVDTDKGAWAKAGIEIRDSTDPASPKVAWGVARNDNAVTVPPAQVMQAAYRDTGGTTNWVTGSSNYWITNHKIDLDSPTPVPVWLRITREPGANGIFNFYYKQTTQAPPALDDDVGQESYWQDALAESVSVSGIDESVVVGLFNASYLAGTASTSNFDDFSIAVADPVLCNAGNAEGQQSFPPLYEVCNQVLQNTSFENIPMEAQWKPPVLGVPQFSGGVSQDISKGNTGNRSLMAQTFDGVPRTPHFYQQFTMPDWVISTTTRFDLNLYRTVDVQASIGSPPDPEDKFYAVIVTSPNDPYNTRLTDPAEVANGNFVAWSPNKLTFQVKAGVNLESYKNQNLYLYFYNDSNDSNYNTPPGSDCADGRCETTFWFDDIKMNVCTTEPAPSPVQTRITGQLILNFTNGSEVLPFVKVWAYAQGVAEGEAEVYETFTIQNGQFNFYNLPPGTYTIFAQYNLVQGTQIETLSDDTTVVLTASNGDTNPAQALLNLFTLGPLP